MEVQLQFTFRNKERNAYVIIDIVEAPCYFFVCLKDEELIEEFGTELSIATDLKTISKKPDTYAEVDNLKIVILEAMKLTKEFERITYLYPMKRKVAS